MFRNLFLQSLFQDDRLVPFIAYAIADGSTDLTHEALLLYIHCAQSHTFPTKWYTFNIDLLLNLS